MTSEFASDSSPSSTKRLASAAALTGVGAVFATAASMGATLAPMAALSFVGLGANPAAQGNLVGLIINGGLPVAMAVVGTVAAGGAFKSASEYLSGEGEDLWKKIASTPAGQKAVELSRKLGDWVIPAGAAVMAVAGAVASHHLGYGSAGLLPAFAAIGTAVIAPLAFAKNLENAADAFDAASLKQLRMARQDDASAAMPTPRKPAA